MHVPESRLALRLIVQRKLLLLLSDSRLLKLSVWGVLLLLSVVLMLSVKRMLMLPVCVDVLMLLSSDAGSNIMHMSIMNRPRQILRGPGQRVSGPRQILRRPRQRLSRPRQMLSNPGLLWVALLMLLRPEALLTVLAD